MKRVTTIVTTVSFLCLLSLGIAAKSKDLKEHVTFTREVWVNNTLVESGRYLIRYDAARGMMRILDGDEVVAEAKATIMVPEEKFEQDAILLSATTKGEVLTGLRLGGQRAELHLSEITAQTETYNFDFHKYQDFSLDMNW